MRAAITRFNDAVCACCGRTATGFGYAPKAGQPIAWVCDDEGCLQVAKNSYALKQDEFTRCESRAAGRGGEEGGAFLDSIGETDLAKLTPDQWFEFCRRIVAGYRKGLIDELQNEAPF
ncbi:MULTISPECIES: DUF6511 domain-containing protein [unclassified Mesorhizobium]|uniref:DUF6511 domain-containing protein n=1 Tax=unclassified Mesorhizobium TaxID=325217 RepID=UPI00112A9CF6|nr:MULTISPECIES: DUF6511 domain-containing protein [unclassified Mesorhizobium]TPK59051.1 hypothetical protein FJ551_25910 [Mesorhizobium sp. B2-5-1]TPL06668.1 hypothetical protein FJ944_22835 [Mesorhizobium sp. B2-4-11]